MQNDHDVKADDPRASREEFLDEYSNFDGIEPKGAEDALREGKWLAHPAWDHWGVMYFDGSEFVERVKQWGQVVGEVRGKTLQDVFDKVNELYGSA